MEICITMKIEKIAGMQGKGFLLYNMEWYL